MGMLARILFSFSRQKRQLIDKKSRFIFYKIVDMAEDEGEYALQCINTHAIFYATLTDIVFDTDILHGLHPIQSCYIGIEYAKHLKSNKLDYPAWVNSKKLKPSQTCRYGRYIIYYQNRAGEVCIIDQNTNQEILLDPRDIALSEEMIQEFDAAQAFSIGLLAGLKMNTPNPVHSQKPAYKNNNSQHLKLVKK